jgi:hypothetical protein
MAQEYVQPVDLYRIFPAHFFINPITARIGAVRGLLSTRFPTKLSTETVGGRVAPQALRRTP